MRPSPPLVLPLLCLALLATSAAARAADPTPPQSPAAPAAASSAALTPAPPQPSADATRAAALAPEPLPPPVVAPGATSLAPQPMPLAPAATAAAGPTSDPAPPSAAAAGTAGLSPEQLQAAAAVFVGEANCDLKERVLLQAATDTPGHFDLVFRKARYRLVPEVTRTGAIRLEDRASGMVWLQIPAKSMLLNTRAGRREADGCRLAEQLADMGKTAPSIGIASQ
jgi:hypothetical protein